MKRIKFRSDWKNTNHNNFGIELYLFGITIISIAFVARRLDIYVLGFGITIDFGIVPKGWS
jgi:hypothetical protein